MLLLEIVVLVLTFFAVMLVAGNNLSACVGPAIGSRIISKQFGILLGWLGFSLGLIFQGAGMTNTVSMLMPNISMTMQVEVLLVAIIIFVIAFLIKAPMSLSMSFVGLLAGLSIISGMSTNIGYILQVVTMWVIAPIVAVVLGYFLTRYVNRPIKGNFWRRLQIYKILLIALAFSTSYVLGANTLGLAVAIGGGFNLPTIIVAVVAIFVGVFFFSSGAIRRVTHGLFLMRYPNAAVSLATATVLVEIATIFGIPLSNTQALVSAILGSGLSYKKKFVSLKPYLTIALSWVAAPLLSFGLGLLIGYPWGL
jgi:inorganic phosphate transporter, PiT family